jgi:hypothetical protein
MWQQTRGNNHKLQTTDITPEVTDTNRKKENMIGKMGIWSVSKLNDCT